MSLLKLDDQAPLIKRIRVLANRSLEMFPSLHLRISGLTRKHPKLVVRRDTELVIEGFSGSANSFAVIAFEYAQGRPTRIAHHLHIKAQVIQAVRWKIPVLMLIRKPRDAVISVSTRFPSQSIRLLLENYIRFYTGVWAYRTELVIGTFEEITTDYGALIEQLNFCFHTSFSIFEHTPENERTCFEKLENLTHLESSRDHGSERIKLNDFGIAAATPTSRVKKDILMKVGELDDPKYRHLMSQAEAIYRKWINYHQFGEVIR